MGISDQFIEAVDLIEKELHFRISGEASAFRLALDRGGKKRLEHCVALVKMWARPGYSGQQKYDRLMRLLALVTPEKVQGGKYRNAAVGAARQAQEALNDELADVLRREP